MDTLKRNHIAKMSSIYDPPQRKTSAEIISEARHAIRESQLPDNSYNAPSIRPLQTQRPYTPRENERHLFGKRGKTNRPPSTFSLRYLQNETDLPQSTNTQENLILSPSLLTASKSEENFSFLKQQRSNSVTEQSENKIFNIGLKELPPARRVRLPALDRPLQRRKLFKNSASLENLPEELDEVKPPEYRNAFSSPQEPTEFNQKNLNSPFGRPSKQQSLSRCLLLGPQNLDKIFDNRYIIENSTTLFIQKVIRSDRKTVDDIINCLNGIGKEGNDDEIALLMDEFYECLERENMLEVKISSKMKIQILKSLYKFVESTNEKLLLRIARIILAIKVTGNNLSGVCKLIFKVAKNDSNDNLFLDKNILELFLDALGRSSPLDDAEACIYAYGTVKFLTMNNKLVEKIIALGILDLMALHMKMINAAKIDKLPVNDQTSHVLYQLTGALRNLASEENIFETFNKSGATDQIVVTMEVFIDDLDIISNISRTLSNISTNETCCDKIVENKNVYKTFIRLFEKYSGSEEIIVRLTYSLGNIVAKIDGTRAEFYYETNSINSLLNLWKIYLERTLKNCSLREDNETEGIGGSAEDVMIKVIRIIANMVINPEIGKEINENYGVRMVDELLKVLISNPFKKNQELVLSILSTLNNLSYYYTSELEQDIFHVRQVDIAEGITEYAKSQNKECVIESMRILGNLSRSKITRSYISDSEIFHTLINALDKSDVLTLKTTIGVFVNLMADNKSRVLFKKTEGVSRLIKILDAYGQSDWLMGTLICQALWNYASDCVDLYDLFTDDEIQKLLVILADYLDDEKIFGIKDDIEDSEIFTTHEYLMWDEFANVATNLLEKIEYFLDTFDQIQLDDKDQTTMKDSCTNLSFAAW